MNLKSIYLPNTYEEMKKQYDKYYFEFYHEMVRMSNLSLTDYIEKYIQIVTDLAKSSKPEDVYRAAIAINALHSFGYNNFQVLFNLFDRIIPQKEIELVKFTSWCAGNLIHHPNVEQSHYVSHLINRLMGWLHSHGRRERHLAAAWMIYELSDNAGSSVVTYLSPILSASNILLIHPSSRVLDATISAYSAYTIAVLRYRRSELNNFLDVLVKLSVSLLSLNDASKQNAAIRLLTALILQVNDYFVPIINELCDHIESIYETSTPIVKSSCISLITAISSSDPHAFIDYFGEKYFDFVKDMALDFPMEITESLILLSKFVGDYVDENMNDIKNVINLLVKNEIFHEAFRLLAWYLQFDPDSFFPFDSSLAHRLVQAPLSEEYRDFFTIFTSYEQFPTYILEPLIGKLEKELSTPTPLFSLQLIANIDSSLFPPSNQLLMMVLPFSTSRSAGVRKAAPKAIFNILQSNESISAQSIVIQELQRAMSDLDLSVRIAVLESIAESCLEELATAKALEMLKVFVNDDAYSVRIATIKILGQLNEINPMVVSGILRQCIVDYFYTLKNLPSIRQCGRIGRLLPHIIRACPSFMKVYTDTFLEIFFDELSVPDQKEKYINFIEENLAVSLKIGLIESLALIAVYDKDKIDKNIERIVTILISYLEPSFNRSLVLTTLRCIYDLLSPMASSLTIRSTCATIFNACSALLYQTVSRKTRIAILKVFGVIGVLDVHPTNPSITTPLPDHIDEDLARKFFQPSRDSDSEIDESYMLDKRKEEMYLGHFIMMQLVNILMDPLQKDYHVSASEAIVKVIQPQKLWMLPLIDYFANQILLLVNEKDQDEETKDKYIEILIQFIYKAGNVIIQFVPQILDFILQNSSRQLSIPIIKIILALVVSIRDAFSPISHSLLCLLLETMENTKTADYESCHLTLQIFEALSPYSGDQTNLIVNQICDAIIADRTLPEICIESIQCLETFVHTHNLMPLIGTIMRSMRTAIFNQNELVKNQGIHLMIVLVKTYGKQFLFACSPIFTKMMECKLTTDELLSAVTSVEVGTNIEDQTQKPTNTTMNTDQSQPIQFNEELIIQKLSNPSFGEERFLRQWLISLTRLMISINPKIVIRECTSIATSSESFTLAIFNPVFLTVWDEMSDEGKQTMAKTILAILEAKETYEHVGRILLTFLVFMHKIQKDFPIAKQQLVVASMKYGYYSFALKLQEELFNSNDKASIEKLINIYTELGIRQNALAVYSMCPTTLKDPTILTKLQLYEQAVESLKSRIKSQKTDPRTFISLIEAYSGMSQWKNVIDLYNTFEIQQRSVKSQAAPIFAEAALRLGNWDMLEDILQYSPAGDFKCNIISALVGIHQCQTCCYINDNIACDDDVKKLIEHGFSLIASRPFSFWAEHQKVHQEIILEAQKLVEIDEMRIWVRSTDKQVFEKAWAQRLITAPRNFNIWFQLISNRMCITKTHDENLVKFFLIKSPSHEIHTNTFNILFPEYDINSAPYIDRLCYIISIWNSGEKDQALDQLARLLPQTADKLRCHCLYLYSSWLIETKDSMDTNIKAYNYLQEAVKLVGNNKRQRRLSSDFEHSSRRISRVSSSFTEYTFTQPTYMLLTSNVMKVEILRKWAFVAAELIELGLSNVDEYVTTAISCLTECVNQGASFPDVVQLLNIFFEHADHPDVFSRTSVSIENLPAQFLIKSTLQLLVQLSHPSKEVAKFVHDIIFKLLPQHYHAIIFSIIVMEESSNEKRCCVASDLFKEFQAAMPVEASEVILIRDALLRVSVTWYDWLMQFLLDIKDAISEGRWNDIVETIDDIVETTKQPSCLLEEVVKQQFSNEISTAVHLLETFTPSSHFHMNSLISWRNQFETNLAYACKDMKYIELQAISQELCNMTHFRLAVPGTYKPEKDIIRIQYFIEQLTIYDTKQQPKSLVIKGEDGSMYQYLLKGHEDLRLDERVMQFFRLVNSILKKESVMKELLLHTMSVIPISSTNGLVQWVPGTDTLRSVIDQYRKIRKFDEKFDEFKMLEQTMFISYDNMMPIQKLNIFNQFCRINPDTDIASFFWLKAIDAEHWLKMINTFATSNSINSAIGYVIGLGDRHPGNLLIDKITGKVVHIDFGDCFEKAMTRRYLPEVVPFRLTRMMIRAMGVTGYNGLFKSSFADVMTIIRENWRVLILVLAIFVHEPLIEIPDSPTVRRRKPGHKAIDSHMAGGKRIGIPRSESVTDEIRSHVKRKLMGIAGSGLKRKVLTVEEQTDILIQEATNPYNMAKMYSGWAPFW